MHLMSRFAAVVFTVSLWTSVMGQAAPPPAAVPVNRAEVFLHDTDEGHFWNPQPQDALLFDHLFLAPGEPLAARFDTAGAQTFKTRLKAPRLTLFALAITDGDPELLRQGRHNWPGMHPTLVSSDWRKLTTEVKDGAVLAGTTELGPGVYRVRAAMADGADPAWNSGLFSEDVFVVISATPASLDLVLPKNRQVFCRSEHIRCELLLRSRILQRPGQAEVRLRHGANTVGKALTLNVPEFGPDKGHQIAANLGLPGTQFFFLRDWRPSVELNTAELAPGSYALEVTALGLTVSRSFEIVEPESPSRIAISENQIPGSPFAGTLMGSPFGGAAVDSLAHGLAAPYADLQVTSLRNELMQAPARLVNARLAATLSELNAGPAAERIGVYDLRQLWMDGMLRQHMGYWQGVQNRALSFSKANTLPGTEDAIRARLTAVARDYYDYPNFFGPQVDVDGGAVRAADQLAWAGIPDPLVTAFRERLTAAQTTAALSTPDAYRSVWDATDARDRAMLALVDPTQSTTANREYHHGTVAGGQYAPALYAGLDLTQIEAWGDAIDNVLFADCWANLAMAARRVNKHEDQPVWIETQAYHADVPGYLQTRWWGALANGADGVGYAANVFGLRQYSGIEPHRPDFKRQTAAAMARLVRTLGPAITGASKKPGVALLFSKTEADAKGGNYGVHCFGAQPPFVSFFALAMAGCQPVFVLEEELTSGGMEAIKSYPVLYLTWHSTPLPAKVQAALVAYQQQGGRIVMDADSTTTAFPSALRVDVKPTAYQGPHAFGGPEDWAWIDAAVPKLRAALDPLVNRPGRATDKRCVTYWRQQGDTQYAIIINESYAPLQTELVLKQPQGGYDLLTGARLEPATTHPVDLRNHAVRILAFTPAPVTGLTARATTATRAGKAIGFAATLRGEGGKALGKTAAPATLVVTGPDGETRWQKWCTVGADSAPAVWQTAATDTPGNYSVTITELLSGKTATFAVYLSEGKPGHLLSAAPAAAVRLEPLDQRALAALRTTCRDHDPLRPPLAIIVDSKQAGRKAQATKLAKAFGKLGHNVVLWENPEQVRLPVGYLFTPEQQALRDKVFAGQAIGERDYLHGHDGDKSAPYAETWEPRTGTAVYRNLIVLGLPGENPLLDQYGPATGPAAVTVGVGTFSGNHCAVFIRGDTEADLERAIDAATDCDELASEPLGPEAARKAFKTGFGMPAVTPYAPAQREVRNATAGQAPITWAAQLGRPVKQVFVSPNGQHLLAKHHGIPCLLGQYTVDGKVERVLTRPVIGDTGDDDVRGIDNDGGLLLADGRILKLNGETTALPATPPPLWRSANGEEQLLLEAYTTEERQDGTDGTKGTAGTEAKAPATAKHQRLVRLNKEQRVYADDTLGDAPGGLLPSANGKYLWQAGNGAGRDKHISAHAATLHDALTGKPLWTKPGWWVFNSVWSKDGEFLAITRHYPNIDRHGIWPEQDGRYTLDLVRAKDGEVVAEGNPTTRPGKLEIGAGNGFVIAWPEFMATHYWLLKPGQDLQKIEASARWLYSGCLAAAGNKIFALDMDGVLWCLQPNGVLIWTNADLQKPAGPELGFLSTCGDDLLLATATGTLGKITWRNGAVVWSQTTAALLKP